MNVETEFDGFFVCRMQDHHCHVSVLGHLVIWSIDAGQATQIKGLILMR